MAKWLVTGSEGFIGAHLCAYLAARHEVLGTYKPRQPAPMASNRAPLDVLVREQASRVVNEFKPDCVVHLAGSKDVNWCEKNPAPAHRLNTDSVRHLATACMGTGSFFIFLSSDHVFEGTAGRYTLQSACRPLTVYGRTKVDAEQLLAGMNLPHAIVRSAGVYARRNPPASLLGWAARSLAGEQDVPAFENVFNSPTYIGDLLQALELLGGSKRRGTFHLAGASRENRHGFLVKFARQFGYRETLVKKSFYEPVAGAQRPLDVSLDSASSYREVGLVFRDATEGLKAAFHDAAD